ncbi:MAG: DUF72 domain-containing protein [Melioribacteraceae bacterium]|nr:DUF72 domain-containing protein [Melioribacteraceae bacterium]MDD3558290.1 DUF72 domain-containing protein [Melioribacteraceae bacterium]
MAKLHIGTCSWKYDSWRGIIYPENGEINYLKEYSHKYKSVEVDQWFWSLHSKNKISLPDPKTAAAYNLSVPDDFRFTIKMPNSITLTHLYKKSKNEPLVENEYFLSSKLLEQFNQNISAMDKKIGMVMFQFEYLNKNKMNSQIDFQLQFADFINNGNHKYPTAIEIRNPNYLNDDYFDFLNENNIYHVFLQGYYMPNILEIYERHKKKIKGKTIIRLHGPDRKGIEELTDGNWNEIVEPKDEELSRIAGMIYDLLNREVEIYLNVNNHYEGCAPKTIDRIKNLLKEIN